MTNLDYLYNKDATKGIFDKNRFIDKKLHFRIIEHGTVIPHKHMYVNGQWTWGFGGIVDSKNNFVKGSAVGEGGGAVYTPTEEIKHNPATVIYIGLFYPVWGHVITDNIRLIWFLTSEVFKNYFKNCPIVYNPWGGVFSLEHQRNFMRLLEVLGVDVGRLQPIYNPTQFENIILPDSSYASGNFTEEYRETIERVRNFAAKNQTPTSSKKVYYFYGRAQTGEERLAEYFKSKGYAIVSPEKLTLDEQLNLMINAESFASTLGSCSHNALFLRDGTEVINIPRAANRFTGYQQMIEQLHPLNNNYVDSSLSIFETFNGPYCFIISEQLRRFFGEEFNGYDEEDFKTFLAYIRSSFSRGFKLNEKSLTYYAPIYLRFYEQLKQREDLTKAYGITLH